MNVSFRWVILRSLPVIQTSCGPAPGKKTHGIRSRRGGVYKSTDGGLTWELKGLEGTQAIGRVVVHPTNSDWVYVAALGHPWGANEERGLYRTRDGGETWERVHYVSEDAGFVDVDMHPQDPNIIWATSWKRVRGLYFLQSGGPGSSI